MCLHPEEIPPVPEQTAYVAKAAFPKGNLYISRSAGSKEFLNNFKILTGQGFCKTLLYSRACTKTKKKACRYTESRKHLFIDDQYFLFA
jgi:hypothetical protein